MSLARMEFLDRALDSGAILTGTPNGSEPITVVFSCEAWRKFDAAELASRTPAASVAVEGLTMLINNLARQYGHCPDLLPGQRAHYNFTVSELHKFAQGLLDANPVAPAVVAEGLTPERIHKLWYRSACAESHGTRECIEHFAKAVEADVLAAHPVAVSQNDVEMVSGALELCEQEDQAAFKRILNQIGVK